MKLINTNQIIDLNIKKAVFYDWAKEVFINKETYLLPPKTSLKWYDGNGFYNTMPSIIPSLGVYGVKVVSRNPSSIPALKSTIQLFDLDSSNPIALMDGNYITAFRTAGCAVLAIETLAIKDYSVIGVIGLGNICRATLLTLLSKVTDRKLTLKLYLFENTDNGIIDLVKDYKNVEIVKCYSIRDTIVDSDVVISCVTFAADNLAEPGWFKSGALLVPIHTRGFMNCDDVFDRVIIDDYDHVKGFANFAKFKNCHELSEVLKNPSFGRNNDKERIIAYNVGISVLDIFFAKKIYDMFPQAKEIEVYPTLENYWIK